MKHQRNMCLQLVGILLLLACLTVQASIEQGQPTGRIQIDVAKVKPSPKPKPKPSTSGGGSSSSGSSVWGSFMGFVLGPILFIAAFPCIWYNQRKASIEYRRLTLAQDLCLDVDPYSQVSAHGTNQQIVFAKGQTLSNFPTYDPVSGVGGPNLLKITRTVSVLQQRKKTRKNNNEQQTYYQLQWCSQNSATEGEQYNSPQNWFIKSQTTFNPNAYLGGYSVPKEVIEKCTKKIDFQLGQQYMNNILTFCNRDDRTGYLNGEFIYFRPRDNNGYTPPAGTGENNYIGGNDQVGTLRVKFQLCPTGPISLVAKSIIEPNRGIFAPYDIAEYEGTKQSAGELEIGCCCCCGAWQHLLIPLEELLLVKEEITTKQTLFQKAFSQSRQFTFIVRILAYCLMVVGILLFFSPVTEILGYIPLVGGFIKGVAGFAIFVGALLACIPLFLITLSVAWVRFHPKVGVFVLLIGLLIFFVFWKTSGPPEQEQ